jgi:hypothetical protein
LKPFAAAKAFEEENLRFGSHWLERSETSTYPKPKDGGGSVGGVIKISFQSGSLRCLGL